MTSPSPEVNDTDALNAALALLTLVTGDDWDRSKLVEQSSELKALATHTLRKQGLTEADAETFVQSRWDEYAADLPVPTPEPAASLQTETPSPSTQTSGDLSATANAEAISRDLPTIEDMQARLADYLDRKAQGEAV